MRAYPIGARVGNVKNDDPGLLDPAADLTDTAPLPV